MRASDVSCQVVFGLLGRWHDGDMAERDRDAYEQHLLFCPPCLRQNDKMRLALAALESVFSAVPDNETRRNLAEIARKIDG